MSTLGWQKPVNLGVAGLCILYLWYMYIHMHMYICTEYMQLWQGLTIIHFKEIDRIISINRSNRSSNRLIENVRNPGEKKFAQYFIYNWKTPGFKFKFNMQAGLVIYKCMYLCIQEGVIQYICMMGSYIQSYKVYTGGLSTCWLKVLWCKPIKPIYNRELCVCVSSNSVASHNKFVLNVMLFIWRNTK